MTIVFLRVRYQDYFLGTEERTMEDGRDNIIREIASSENDYDTPNYPAYRKYPIQNKIITVEEISEDDDQRQSYSILDKEPEHTPDNYEEDSIRLEDTRMDILNAISQPAKTPTFCTHPDNSEVYKKFFGEKLISYFQTYFEPFTNGKCYTCSEST